MGDQDIAAAWAYGKVWFKVPATVRVELAGRPLAGATAKDVGLALLRHFGANGLLGCAAELYGDYAEALDLAGRITIASLATEMGAIILLFPPDEARAGALPAGHGRQTWPPSPPTPTPATRGWRWSTCRRLGPMVARPGHPEDVVPLESVRGRKIDSRLHRLLHERPLRGPAGRRQGPRGPEGRARRGPQDRAGHRRHVAPCHEGGPLRRLQGRRRARRQRRLRGCAAGQIGQNGPGEVTVSTGNRNFAGKQGKGEVYLASPGRRRGLGRGGHPHRPRAPPRRSPRSSDRRSVREAEVLASSGGRRRGGRSGPAPRPQGPRVGRAKDNIDTDMIFHNRHLAITELEEMGQHTFGNLDGLGGLSPEGQARRHRRHRQELRLRARSRQQAVDCFKALGRGAPSWRRASAPSTSATPSTPPCRSS